MTAMSEPVPHPSDDLDDLRGEIDHLDRRILELIEHRLDLARRTLPVKARHGLRAVDTRREAEVVRRAASHARARGIEPELVREIWWRLIELSRVAGAVGVGAPEPVAAGERS